MPLTLEQLAAINDAVTAIRARYEAPSFLRATRYEIAVTAVEECERLDCAHLIPDEDEIRASALI